jgi:hypothetical protein
MPYGFPSGEKLLELVRYTALGFLEDLLGLEEQDPLFDKFMNAVTGTLARSLDAMLETREDLVAPGKRVMAKNLLECEVRALRANRPPKHGWYGELWDAFDLRSLDTFRATPLTIVTYNYDRTLEYRLHRSLQERFGGSDEDCAKALDCIGPIHVHGQLGLLPGFSSDPGKVVEFGGSSGEIQDSDVVRAAEAIQIVHEANPLGETFARAQSAIAAAEKVVFLGFGYARQNVARLRLKNCMQRSAALYLCMKGYTPEQQEYLILPQFAPWQQSIAVGGENEDIVQFLRRFPQVLL